MKTSRKPDRPDIPLHSSVVGFQGNTSRSRRQNSLRSVMLENNVVNTDKIFGATQAIRKSIEETFGRPD
jgi:hypothetical protein